VEKGGIAFKFVPGKGEGLLEYFERNTPNVNEAFDTAPPQQSLLSMDANVVDGTLSTVVAVSTGDEAPVDMTPVETPELQPEMAEAARIETSEVVETVGIATKSETTASASSEAIALDMYGDFLSKLAHVLQSGPLSEEEVAERLVLEKGQAKVWLKRAVEMGQVERLKKPVRFAQGRQSSLLA
jgi:hypothetical protein